MRWQPAVRIAPAYYDAPAYIEALASSLEEGIAKMTFKPDVILASYHGMPEDYLRKGDPYYCQCAVTTRLLRERLKLDESKLMMTFQSRFGPAEWLKPYTDMTVKGLAEKGVKNIAVITPGFASDCLETLEEIAIEKLPQVVGYLADGVNLHRAQYRRWKRGAGSELWPHRRQWEWVPLIGERKRRTEGRMGASRQIEAS
jgi:ferrochelatase